MAWIANGKNGNCLMTVTGEATPSRAMAATLLEPLCFGAGAWSIVLIPAGPCTVEQRPPQAATLTWIEGAERRQASISARDILVLLNSGVLDVEEAP
jgi:hypothetical protein